MDRRRSADGPTKKRGWTDEEARMDRRRSADEMKLKEAEEKAEEKAEEEAEEEGEECARA
jgi:hypothetical protein